MKLIKSLMKALAVYGGGMLEKDEIRMDENVELSEI